MNRFVALCVFALAAAPFVAQATDFVGAASCRSCHQEAYEHWQAGPHASAHLSLTPAQAKDPKCIQCHTPDEASGGTPGVSCETCHGAGEYYSAEYVMRDAELARATGLVMPKALDCLLCHDATSPSLEKFNVEQKMREIDHWTKSRAARRKAAAKGPCELPARQKAARTMKLARPDATFLGQALVESSPPRKTSPSPAQTQSSSTVSMAQANAGR